MAVGNYAKVAARNKSLLTAIEEVRRVIRFGDAVESGNISPIVRVSK